MFPSDAPPVAVLLCAAGALGQVQQLAPPSSGLDSWEQLRSCAAAADPRKVGSLDSLDGFLCWFRFDLIQGNKIFFKEIT